MTVLAGCTCGCHAITSRPARCARPLQPFTASITQLAPRRIQTCVRAVGSSEGDDSFDLTAAFNRELEKRDMASAAASETAEAQGFDGEALLQLLLERYDRSYDVTLVKREMVGKTFVAMNIMWAYREQKSFQLTEEEHMNRLDYVAAALRQWGLVGRVKDEVFARKDRPRVGKAISIQLDVDEEVANEWFGS